MIIYKFGYPDPQVSPDISPFVIKLETWLRMSGIPYETRTGANQSMPHQKLPVAMIAGELVPDSSLIIQHLQYLHPQAISDQQLSASERARACALRALFEQHLYFVLLYNRYAVPANFNAYKPLLLDYAKRSTPAWQKPFLATFAPLIFPFVQMKYRRMAWQQGTGRHKAEDINAMGIEVWKSVKEILGDQPFLLGEQPSLIDATAFGFLNAEIRHPFPSPIHDYVLGQPTLVAYHDRIWDRYWKQPVTPSAADI